MICLAFKLMSCKPGASRELDLRPPRPEKLDKCSKLIFGNKIIVIRGRDKFYFFCFLNKPEV